MPIFDFQVTVFCLRSSRLTGKRKDGVLERCNAVICRGEAVPLVGVPNLKVVAVTDNGDVAVKLELLPSLWIGLVNLSQVCVAESCPTVVAAAFSITVL